MGLVVGLFIKEKTRGGTDLETATERLSGDPFNMTIRHLIQEEIGVNSWMHETEVQMEVETGETDLLTIIHRWNLKLDMRSPKETWYLEKRKGPKTKTKDTPDFTCQKTKEDQSKDTERKAIRKM